jgi:predicted DNA-binding transcriptional regulator AlpA
MEFLTATQVRQRFGGISDMTLWRWMRDERVSFPQPLVINRRRYFRAADLEAFQKRQAAHAAGADAA